jgi:hypothetical protein
MSDEIRQRLTELLQDVKEVKTQQLDLIKQGAIHNELLRTHEARSLALQAEVNEAKKELAPIKAHVKLVQGGLALGGAILTGVLIHWLTSI